MAITDIDISEELQTSAPSIKYSGSEGPKSPEEEQQMMMAQLEDAYEQYVDEMIEMGMEPMSMQQFIEQAMAEGQMSGGQPLPQDPTKPVNPFQPKPQGPVLPDRQMAAFGGIMGVDGRRKYGIGSKLKKFFRKVVPNELSSLAVKAAPFIAPFNPLAAGVMSGLGSFDQTGRIGSSLKSGLMNYGLGNISRMAGGAGFQGGLKSKAMAGQTGLGSYFTSPTSGARLFGGTPKANVSNTIPVDNKQMAGKNYTIDNATGKVVMRPEEGLYSVSGDLDAQAALTDKALKNVKLASQDSPLANLKSKIMEYVPTSLGEINPLGPDFDIKKFGGGITIFEIGRRLLGDPKDVTSQIMDRGESLDIDGIRTEVLEAYRDPSGEKLKALAIKYPYINQNADVVNVAQGGRIGMAEGGIMDLGGMEKDYRAEGGFVPIGREEKADDVPARLSVNEFVFTADAVRNAGGGDIDRGAEVMENMMKNLEAGGQVSEESQGMAGAQQMFETSERLSEVI
jgi:hypothetical protein